MRKVEASTDTGEEVRAPSSFENLLWDWDGETAVIRRDPESGAWIFVCLHSTRLGPAGGGTRMKVYATPAEALEDAMRLSAAMTRKLAIAGLPFGGGKAVLPSRRFRMVSSDARCFCATGISSRRWAGRTERARTSTRTKRTWT